MSKYILSVVTIVLLSFSYSFGQRMYLKVGNQTQNGSTNNEYKDYIEIDAAQFGASSNINIDGGKPAAGKPDFGELVISKLLDKLSIYFLQCLAGSAEIPKIELVLTFSSPDTGTTIPRQKIELNGAYVTSISNGVGVCSECGFAETVSLKYRQIRITYHTYDERWRPGTPSVFSYDLVLGKQSFTN